MSDKLIFDPANVGVPHVACIGVYSEESHGKSLLYIPYQQDGKEAYAAYVIAAVNQREKLVRALEGYIQQFDDESLSNDDMKAWLDRTWIPTIRALLERVKEE